MRAICLGIAALLAAAWVSSAVGQDEAESERQPAEQYQLLTEVQTDPVNYRMFVKQAMEAHIGAFGLILTQRAPGTEQLPFHADALVTLMDTHASLYPEGSETDGTRDSIWEQEDQFAEASATSAKRARDLREAVEAANYYVVMNQLVRLGESCESCHARFRSGSAD